MDDESQAQAAPSRAASTKSEQDTHDIQNDILPVPIALTFDVDNSASSLKTPPLDAAWQPLDEASQGSTAAGGVSSYAGLDGFGRTEANSEDEVDVISMIRMLEDRHGRLQFVGDSANISFVQLLRMMVETIFGPSAFTLDPERHRMIDTSDEVSLDPSVRHLLPGYETTCLLVKAFFTNTFGILQIFDEQTYFQDLDRFYATMVATDPVWLSQLHLVLAMGLTLGNSATGGREMVLLDSLRSTYPNRCQEYFLVAKRLHDPLSDLESADFTCTQTLTLMALYMLYQGRRNAAYFSIGMAIRLAYSQGLHREDILDDFPKEVKGARRKLWRSLFTIDCYLSVSLGRPLAIEQSQLSPSSLPMSLTGDGTELDSESSICRGGLDSVVRSCHVMRSAISNIYSRRKISIRKAQSLANECGRWPKELPRILRPQHASSKNIRQAMAILHCNLAYYHSIILLTRPFFLYLMSTEIQREHLKMNIDLPEKYNAMRRLSDACMAASTQAITLVLNAFEGGYLPCVDFWPTYGVFGAALVIYANELARPFSDKNAGQSMQNSIFILDYCGKVDPLANRSAHILRAFLDVLHNRDRSGYSADPQQQQQDDTSMVSSERSLSSADLMPYQSIPPPPPPPPNSNPSSSSRFANIAPADTAGGGGEGIIAAAMGSSAAQWPFNVAATGQQPTAAEDLNQPPPMFSGLSDSEDFTQFPLGNPVLTDPMLTDEEEDIDFNRLWDWPTGGATTTTTDPAIMSNSNEGDPVFDPFGSFQ